MVRPLIFSGADVRQRPQGAVLFASALSSGRRGRRFKSGHPDQKQLATVLVREGFGDFSGALY